MIFNESKLQEEIIKTWGKSGAHNEVFEAMTLQIKELTEQLRLYGVGRSFIHELIKKETDLRTKLSENLDLYKEKNNMVEYDKTFSQWNKCNLVLWDLKDILCRMGEDID